MMTRVVLVLACTSKPYHSFLTHIDQSITNLKSYTITSILSLQRAGPKLNIWAQYPVRSYHSANRMMYFDDRKYKFLIRSDGRTDLASMYEFWSAAAALTNI